MLAGDFQQGCWVFGTTSVGMCVHSVQSLGKVGGKLWGAVNEVAPVVKETGGKAAQHMGLSAG